MATLIETNLISLGVDAVTAKKISDDFQKQLDQAQENKKNAKRQVDAYQAQVDLYTADITRLKAILGP